MSGFETFDDIKDIKGPMRVDESFIDKGFLIMEDIYGKQHWIKIYQAQKGCK